MHNTLMLSTGGDSVRQGRARPYNLYCLVARIAGHLYRSILTGRDGDGDGTASRSFRGSGSLHVNMIRHPSGILARFCPVLVLVLAALPARAATTNCAMVNIQTCINAASVGDTLNMGAGTYSGTVNIPNTKTNLKIIGAGPITGVVNGSTTFQSIVNGRFVIDQANGVQISGIRFNQGGSYSEIWLSQGFRIDHCRIEISSHGTGILANGWQATGAEGLIDHNYWLNGSLIYYGDSYSTGPTYHGGNDLYAQPLQAGTAHAIYMEDNIFHFNVQSGSYPSMIDGRFGSRVVVRFNTIENGRMEQHSVQGDGARAVRLWEFYNNTLVNPDTQNYRTYFIRGGTGYVFHNTSNGNFMVEAVVLDNARSNENSIAGQVPVWGFPCDGTKYVDGNTAGQQGWPCRDQIGTSTDSFVWARGGPNPAPTQALDPAYIWRNRMGGGSGGELPVQQSCEAADANCARQNTYHIVQNRDYYAYNASFNGTTGVGEGTLANRPATCTTGVGYWATDQGSWNQSGQSGVLYACGPANTWSVKYTPYTYPHPLQGGAPPCSIAPTSLPTYTAGQAVSQQFTASNCNSSTWAISGNAGSGLSINSATGLVSGTAVGGSFTITITYDTGSTGPMSLTVAEPIVSLDHTSHDFGSQMVGVPTTGWVANLQNTGNAALTITSITPSGDFSASSNCPISPSTLGIGSSCAITSTFTPTQLGARAGSVSIVDNAADTPQVISLSGTGTPTLAGSIGTGVAAGTVIIQ